MPHSRFLQSPLITSKFLDQLFSILGQADAMGITTIASGSMPAAATLDLTGIAETYAYLVLQLTGISSNTATRQPYVRFSVDNGSTFPATSGDYIGFKNSVATIADLAAASVIESATQAAANTFDVTISIFNYHTGPYAHFVAKVTGTSISTHTIIGTFATSTDNIDAIRVLWSGTGNFDAGTYALYGVS